MAKRRGDIADRQTLQEQTVRAARERCESRRELIRASESLASDEQDEPDRWPAWLLVPDRKPAAGRRNGRATPPG